MVVEARARGLLGAEEGGAAERRGGGRRGGEEEGEGEGEPEQEEEQSGVLPQLGGEGGGCWASPRLGISHGGGAGGRSSRAPLWSLLCFCLALGHHDFFSELAGSAHRLLCWPLGRRGLSKVSQVSTNPFAFLTLLSPE